MLFIQQTLEIIVFTSKTSKIDFWEKGMLEKEGALPGIQQLGAQMDLGANRRSGTERFVSVGPWSPTNQPQDRLKGHVPRPNKVRRLHLECPSVDRGISCGSMVFAAGALAIPEC